ncbi:MAG: hypothetical protein H7A51_08670 [Akkermansiaceae bacterium]|nr:hypothetical protein [Akkermansiaceae bacterium]
MKNTKHMKWLSLVAMLSFSLPAAALEEREFKSSDESKSFTATLTDYNAARKTATVTLKNGIVKSFDLSLLSEEDQKYVIDSADELAVSRSVSVSFKEVKGETTRTKSGLVRTRSTPTSYEIQVYNRSDKVIEDLEIRYSLYYCVGSSSATGPSHTPQVLKGSLIYPKLFGKYNETRATSEVVLIRESKKGVAPPVPSGGGGG